jgi:hypothetical protein
VEKMNQNRAVDKAMQSIESIVPLNDEQYKTVTHHLLLIYGVGFEEGRRKEPGKMIGQYLDGILVNSYENFNQAQAETGINKVRIKRSTITKKKTGIFNWEYLEE